MFALQEKASNLQRLGDWAELPQLNRPTLGIRFCKPSNLKSREIRYDPERFDDVQLGVSVGPVGFNARKSNLKKSKSNIDSYLNQEWKEIKDRLEKKISILPKKNSKDFRRILEIFIYAQQDILRFEASYQHLFSDKYKSTVKVSKNCLYLNMRMSFCFLQFYENIKNVTDPIKIMKVLIDHVDQLVGFVLEYIPEKYFPVNILIDLIDFTEKSYSNESVTYYTSLDISFYSDRDKIHFDSLVTQLKAKCDYIFKFCSVLKRDISDIPSSLNLESYDFLEKLTKKDDRWLHKPSNLKNPTFATASEASQVFVDTYDEWSVVYDSLATK